MTPDNAREIAKDLVAAAHYGVMTNEQLEDRIAEALLSARREGRKALTALYEACERRANEEGGDFGAAIGPAAELAEAALSASPSPSLPEPGERWRGAVSDLVERLLLNADCDSHENNCYLRCLAAGEIKRLEGERDRLRNRTHEIQAEESAKRAQLGSDLTKCRNYLAAARAVTLETVDPVTRNVKHGDNVVGGISVFVQGIIAGLMEASDKTHLRAESAEGERDTATRALGEMRKAGEALFEACIRASLADGDGWVFPREMQDWRTALAKTEGKG